MKHVILRFLLLIVVIGGGGVIVYVSLYYEPNLPIYNPSDINPQLVDKTVRGEMRNHSVGDFKLTNQLNETITPDNFKNKIYVACFIFTTCEGICPAMTGNLKSVYKEYLDDDETFCLTYGDGLANINIKDLITYHYAHKRQATITATLPPGRFGSLSLNEDSSVSESQENKIAMDNTETELEKDAVVDIDNESEVADAENESEKGGFLNFLFGWI